ncbi:hypothetical protein BKA61DRAFT_499673 [Leptodontidium sp. MPI-SDFR-AT-0119]|nr:hypothetical protein BKA61DRAFT_499673 [Leptodontidium sp. MPI-SDFR-AT-0119]
MASSPASKRTCSHVPPENPTFQASERPLTLEHLEELLLKLVGAKSTDSAGKSEDSESTTSEDTQQEDVVAPASRLEFKTVYEVWDSKAHKYTIRESAEPKVDELDQYAFTEETTFHVDIKSEWLRDVLRDVLKDVQVISLKDGKLSVLNRDQVEQKLLFHYLPELESCQIWNEIAPLDQLGSEHIRLLVDYLKQTYETTTRHLESLLQSGEITYDLLWALFKPNSFAFTTCSGTQRPRCVKYDFGEEKKTKSGSKYWNIECRYLDFDGADLGESSIELKIPMFRGVKRINALQAFPLQYHSDANRVKADLLRCGREFVRLMGTHHLHCRGTAFVMFKGKQVKISVDSRIMIDAAFFRKMNPNYSRRSITEDTDAGSIPLFDLIRVSREPPPEWVRTNGMEPADLTDDDFLICCPTVPGFSFNDKLWAEFAVADIKEIQWSSTPFDCLTIPNEQEEAVMALLETKTRQVPGFGFDDFVAGKGRGVNILLHGLPGLGKTLTAEAASERLELPLYSISAGELSTKAAQLEEQLSVIFQIASHWNAILLLDEADVYLEARSPQNLERNALVSVFLRKLEYCEGVMFLTTNRVSQFDLAILSRIHLMLRYDNLSKDARSEIWGQFLSRAATPCGDADIKDCGLWGLYRGLWGQGHSRDKRIPDLDIDDKD